jgi:hypothetical protein
VQFMHFAGHEDRASPSVSDRQQVSVCRLNLEHHGNALHALDSENS